MNKTPYDVAQETEELQEEESFYAESPYLEFVSFLNFEANRFAEELGVSSGGILVCLKARNEEARAWLEAEGDNDSFVSVYHFIKKEADILENIPESELNEIVDIAANRPVIKLHNEDHLYCNNYGTSICYPIHEHIDNKTSLDVVLLVCCRNSKDERDICIRMRNSIKEWCERENKWLPRLHLRSREAV